MWRHYVYLHRKADSGAPFYIGKGSMRPRDKMGATERAFATERRNVIWHRTVAKHGLLVEVLAFCADDFEAQRLERAMIAEIGRRDLGLGPLINLTDGGDGQAGLLISPETRAKRSIAASRPRSDEWIASIRMARKGGGNGGVVKHGDRLPQAWRDAIAVTKVGRRNPMFGRTGANHPRSRPVIDQATGRSFASVTAAAAHLGLRMQTLHNMLTGFRPNSTAMRFG